MIRKAMIVRVPTSLVANPPPQLDGYAWERGNCVKCDAEVWIEPESSALAVSQGCIPLDFCCDCAGMREQTVRGARKMGLIDGSD